MTGYLLDANALIALSVESTTTTSESGRWTAGIDRFALCSISEAALVRYLIRIGERIATATDLLAAMRTTAGVDFWADTISYADADLSRVRGHAQVTDAYLAALAAANSGVLATLDVGLVHEWPESTFLVPV